MSEPITKPMRLIDILNDDRWIDTVYEALRKKGGKSYTENHLAILGLSDAIVFPTPEALGDAIDEAYAVLDKVAWSGDSRVLAGLIFERVKRRATLDEMTREAAELGYYDREVEK